MPRIFIAFVCAFSLLATAAIAKEFSSVEEQMSSRDFKAAGLDKLSPEELAALNAWIRNNQPASSGVAYNRASDDLVRIGFDDSEARDVITSNIIGEFSGWRGGTTFKLENGQVWQVADASELVGIKARSNPKITIRPGLIGGWRMQVDGFNSVAKVRRVK